MEVRYLFIIIVTLLIQTESFGASTQKNAANPFKILVFWKTAGYPHAAIPEQITYFQAWGTKYGFDVENSNKPEIWTKDYLNQYAAVVLLSTTGNFLNDSQKVLFKNYENSIDNVGMPHKLMNPKMQPTVEKIQSGNRLSSVNQNGFISTTLMNENLLVPQLIGMRQHLLIKFNLQMIL